MVLTVAFPSLARTFGEYSTDCSLRALLSFCVALFFVVVCFEVEISSCAQILATPEARISPQWLSELTPLQTIVS